eukprot:m.113418 g.113418  ORF g.113418 m.113418 type:complete len:508 (+) comp15443_c1_seq1:166-1689(+)
MSVSRIIAKLRTYGNPGEYMIYVYNNDGDDHIRRRMQEPAASVYVSVTGMAHSTRLVGYRTEDGVLIPTIMTDFDAINASLTLTWCDGAFVHCKRVPLAKCLADNPRLRCHPTGLHVIKEGDRFHLEKQRDPACPSFASIDDLVEHYKQHSFRLRSWQNDGSFIDQRLTRLRVVANLKRSNLLASAVRQKEALLCLDIDHATAAALLSQHWCQTGDFLIRKLTTDEQEAAPNTRYALSMMLAIRVHHNYVLLDEDGLLYVSDDVNRTKYATLCDLIDYLIIHERCEGIPFRRIVFPNQECLAKARRDSPNRSPLHVEPEAIVHPQSRGAKRSCPNPAEASSHDDEAACDTPESMDGVTQSLSKQALQSDQSDWDDQADAHYNLDVRDLRYFSSLNNLPPEQPVSDVVEAQSHPSLSLGAGSESVPSARSTVTKPQARLQSLYDPFGSTPTLEPSPAPRPSSYPSYRAGAVSESSFEAAVARRPPPRSFSWAALTGSNGQNEIDDVFE